MIIVVIMVVTEEYFIRGGFLVIGFIFGRLAMALQCDFFIPKNKRRDKRSHIGKALFIRR